MSRRRNLWVGWTLALLAIVLFANLGLWQARRAGEKQAMLDEAAQVLARREPGALSLAADTRQAKDFQWARGWGRFDARGPLWLDNQQRAGRAGVRAYWLFHPEAGGAPLLVDLGWLPLPADRRLPPVVRPEGRVELRGLLAPPPSTGLRLGEAVQPRDQGWLLTRVEAAAIAEALDLRTAPAARVLRLDPDLPMGYDRDLALLANTLPPEKHRGYSLQWFALALAVLVTALILTFRKARP